MNRTLVAIARGQHALITLDQARAEGLTPRGACHRVGAQRWERVHPGVYRLAGAPRTWAQELLAACLAAGPGAVASHRSAALLWALDGVAPGWLEIAVCRPSCHRLAGVVVHRSTDLDQTVALARQGIPVTAPARTIVDLGAVAPPHVVERALESAVGRRLVTIEGLRKEVDLIGRRGRRGAGVLRALLAERGVGPDRTDSVLEARMLRLFRRHALPAPKSQHEVRVGRRLVGRVDFAYPASRLAVEVDGYEPHASLVAFRHDRTRQNDLVAAGWTVLRFTSDDVARRPEQVAAAIRRVLGAISDDNRPLSRQDR